MEKKRRGTVGENMKFLAVVLLGIHHCGNGKSIANYSYQEYQEHVYQEDVSQDSSIWCVLGKLSGKAVKVRIFSYIS